MAVKTLEEIIASLDGEQQKFLEGVFSKAPELKAGWLRQDDYSRRQNEIKDQLSELENLKAYEAEMKGWSDKTYKTLEGLREAGVLDENDNEIWSTQKKDLEDQINAAKLAGGDVDPKELEARVKEIVAASGGVTKEELSNIIKNEQRKAAETVFSEQWKNKETDFNTKTIPFVAGFSSGTSVVAMHYEKETGKPWTREVHEQFNKIMAEKQNFDPYAVEEIFLEPYRSEKAKEAEIEKRAQALAEKKLQERGFRPGSEDDGFIPQPIEQKGALQTALENSASEDSLEAILSKSIVEGAQELNQAGKF